jgi:hypothetical protein
MGNSAGRDSKEAISDTRARRRETITPGSAGATVALQKPVSIFRLSLATIRAHRMRNRSMNKETD